MKQKLIYLIPLLFLISQAFACTNQTTGKWINCTISYNQSNPIGSVFQTINGNFKQLWGFVYFIILVFAFGIFRLYNPSALAAAYASFLSLIVSAVMISYNLLSGTFMDMSVGLFVLSLIVLFLFR